MNYKDKILYVLTFLSFSSINFLNVSYSFVKRFIETDFNMTSTEIGIADGLKFFGTIIGLFLYINFDIIKKHKITLFYCVSIILNGVSMGMIPILSIFKENAKWSVFLFNFLGGMTKAPCWPLLLQIVKETIFNEKNIKKNVNEEKSNLFNQENVKNEENFEKNKKSNKSFIVWTSLTLLGNIFGLVIQEQLVYSVNLRWEFCLIVSVVSIIFFSITLGVYYYMSYALSDGEGQLKRNSESFHNDKDASLILKCLEILFLTKNCLFTWSLVLILSIHSVMMMFLPLFLYKLGYHQYEGYILGWYNLCVVFGTIIFTCLDIDRILNVKFLIVPKNEPEFVNEDGIFHDISNDTETEERNEKECEFETANLISLFLLVGTCIFLVTLPCFYSCSEVPFTGEIPPYEINNSYKVIEYFAVIGFFGLFLGGPLNKYESIEFVSVLKEFETNSKEFYHSCESINSDVESLGNQTTKIYIGMVQIFSYLTVMFFLVLAGRIIDTNILSFFYLIGILSAMIFILDVIRIIECKFGNDYE